MRDATIREMSAADYHGDTYGEPALSKSIIHTIRTQSPLHAWTNHPALNPNYVREEDDRFDLGTAAHSLFLENDPTGVVVLDFDNYTTKAAKEARDYARSEGKIPMLQKYWDRTVEMVSALKDGCAAIDVGSGPPLFRGGKAEQTMTWREGGKVLCKGRLDFLHDDGETIDDLKTTGRLAAPERIPGLMVGGGYDVQAAFYLRGLQACGAKRPVFRFVFVETTPPYAVSCYTPSPAMLALAERKIDFALGVWRRCIERNEWPGYPALVMMVDPPTWEETHMYEREYREEAAA